MDGYEHDNARAVDGQWTDGYCAVITRSDPARTHELFTRVVTTMPTIHDEALVARDVHGRLRVARRTSDASTGRQRSDPEQAQGSAPDAEGSVERLVTLLQGPLGCLFATPGQRGAEPPAGRTRGRAVGGATEAVARGAMGGVVCRIISSLPAGEQLIVAEGSGHPCALDALLRQTGGHMTTLTAAQLRAELDDLEAAEEAATQAALRVLTLSPRDQDPHEGPREGPHWDADQRRRWLQRSREYQRRLRSA